MQLEQAQPEVILIDGGCADCGQRALSSLDFWCFQEDFDSLADSVQSKLSLYPIRAIALPDDRAGSEEGIGISGEIEIFRSFQILIADSDTRGHRRNGNASRDTGASRVGRIIVQGA